MKNLMRKEKKYYRRMIKQVLVHLKQKKDREKRKEESLEHSKRDNWRIIEGINNNNLDEKDT